MSLTIRKEPCIYISSFLISKVEDIERRKRISLALIGSLFLDLGLVVRLDMDALSFCGRLSI